MKLENRSIAKVMVCYGTRPEVIKVSPVIRELQRRGLACCTVFTGQHKDLYEDVRDMAPEPDYNLAVMQDNQSLTDIVARLAVSFVPVLRKEKPDILLVQGDTSTAAVCALLGFYEKVPVGHIEAGLRTYDLSSPFPEEGNRQLISRIAKYSWAPTERAYRALLSEGVSGVSLTGNTVIDACLAFNFPVTYSDKVLVTLHRRENFGEKMERQFQQIEELAARHRNIEFIFPMHPNPNVQRHRHLLRHVNVIPPLGYPEMMRLLSSVSCVISDSGGIQEECAAFRKRILVCRDTTERQEGIEAGFARLVDAEIIENFDWAMSPDRWNGVNPFGDGLASERIVDTLISC